jgi:hypothetical protein
MPGEYVSSNTGYSPSLVRPRLEHVSLIVVAAVAFLGSSPDSPRAERLEVRSSIAVPDGAAAPRGRPLARAEPAAPAARALVGPTRSWPSLDAARNRLYAKPFTLAATGRRVEIWVARNLLFPQGDCRNTVDGRRRVAVTKAQATYLARQFDQVIFPGQRALFGTPRARDGRRATDPRFVSSKRGTRTIVLVDNIRDANYYDRDNSRNTPYIAGFHARDLSAAVDRNVVTLDAFDWAHRLRANPPHAPVPEDNCASAPARPFLYEGTLAHEYQHLLQSTVAADDEWIDEGLADFAQTLAGYARPSRRIDELGFDSHVQCLLGWLAVATPFNPQPRGGGPENSLTRWSDEGDAEILCDYGAAYAFVHFLADRYGTAAAGALFREPAAGLEGVGRVLERMGAAEDAFGLMHDWSAALALDAALERGTPLRVGDVQRFQSRTLSASVNWDNPDAYSTPGAPPNGSDFVRLRDSTGRNLAAAELESIAFAGTRQARRGVGYTLQLIGYATDPAVPATQVTVQLADGVAATLDADTLRALFDPRVDVVAAIVTYDDRTESLTRAGRYALTVNGVAQPGG